MGDKKPAWYQLWPFKMCLTLETLNARESIIAWVIGRYAKASNIGKDEESVHTSITLSISGLKQVLMKQILMKQVWWNKF